MQQLVTKQWRLAATVLAWAALVAAGSVVLVDYSVRPGDGGAPPDAWPSGAALELDDVRPTLVMVAHPACPCTSASVEELARLMATAHGKVRAYVVLSGRTGTNDRSSDTGLAAEASRIPGVDVVADADGAVAELLGVATSGHVLLFGPDGSRRFSGGITAARGHVGDNVGHDAARAAIAASGAVHATTPVYGCAVRGGAS